MEGTASSDAPIRLRAILKKLKAESWKLGYGRRCGFALPSARCDVGPTGCDWSGDMGSSQNGNGYQQDGSSSGEGPSSQADGPGTQQGGQGKTQVWQGNGQYGSSQQSGYDAGTPQPAQGQQAQQYRYPQSGQSQQGQGAQYQQSGSYQGQQGAQYRYPQSAQGQPGGSCQQSGQYVGGQQAPQYRYQYPQNGQNPQGRGYLGGTYQQGAGYQQGQYPPQGGQPQYPQYQYQDPNGKKRKHRMTTPAWIVVCLVVAIACFAGGLYAANNGFFLMNGLAQEDEEGEDAPATEVAQRLYKVAQLLDTEGYYNIDLDEATEGAIEALLESTGDAHAEYYTEEEYESYLEYSTGSYEGLGIVIAQCGKYTMVTTVYEGTPAEEAGVQVGDVVVSLDGVEQDWTPSDFTEALEREVGETADVVWLRPTEESLDEMNEALAKDDEANADIEDSEEWTSTYADKVVLEGEEIETTVTYDEITIPNVDYELKGTVGYIQLTSFNLESGEAVEEAVEDLESQGATSLVLDLRDNGGGYVSQAIEIVSLFVEDGDVMQYSYNSNIEVESVTGDAITDLPLVVLVNENSASASEITASALQDNDRATIVGTVTYGKGTVQDLVPLSFGGAVKYTIAEYLSADGNTINEVGVQPDVEVEYELTSDGTDSQLEKALETAESLE